MRTLWRDDIASSSGEFVRFDSIRVNPKPAVARHIPIVLGGNSDAALRRAVDWGDGWYGFNLNEVSEVAERIEFLNRLCDDSGRDRSELQLAVALRDMSVDHVHQLADLGVDELVVVDGPPQDPAAAADWVSTLADKWMSGVRS
jgi:alkanesulfonate monooxygenase SsuD/methylene tetrahydromethanopterin reductase-like flavin-dependent oxidoreductase (luciferase family)